jgi:drug/metabolite transporter (DMT)-like permease
MALTVPIGGLSFLVMTIVFDELHHLVMFPMAAAAWLACQGIVHFVIGRYCNYKSNQLMGVNLTAPVVQLQVPFTMLLAVVMLHENFTVLQAVGSALMLGGRLLDHPEQCWQRKKESASGDTQPDRTLAGGTDGPETETKLPTAGGLGLRFRPRRGDLLWQLAPDGARGFRVRTRRQHGGWGLRSYAAATLFFLLILFKPGSWADIRSTKLENLPWFLSSAVLVAISQAFVYASLAVAPLMVVTPILQLSLVFRLFLSQLINRDQEVLNAAVIIGAFTAVPGSILVSLDTDELTMFLQLPLWFADFLQHRLAGH